MQIHIICEVSELYSIQVCNAKYLSKNFHGAQFRRGQDNNRLLKVEVHEKKNLLKKSKNM